MGRSEPESGPSVALPCMYLYLDMYASLRSYSHGVLLPANIVSAYMSHRAAHTHFANDEPFLIVKSYFSLRDERAGSESETSDHLP